MPLSNRKSRRRARAIERTQARHQHRERTRRRALARQPRRLAGTGARMTLQAMASVMVPEDESQLPTFTIDAYSGGEMYPHLDGVDWSGPVVVEISGLRAAATLPVHRDHDVGRPVGHSGVTLTERITCAGSFSLNNPDVWDIRDGARNGFPWRGSIGLSNMEIEIFDQGQSATVNGRDWDGPVMIVRSADLDEVSIVTIPGDRNVGAVLAAANKGVNGMNFSQWLKAQGWDESKLNAAQRATLRAAYKAAVASGSLRASGAQASGDGDDDEELSGEGGSDDNEINDDDLAAEGGSDEDDEDEELSGEGGSDDDEEEDEGLSGGRSRSSRNRRGTVRAGGNRGSRGDSTGGTAGAGSAPRPGGRSDTDAVVEQRRRLAADQRRVDRIRTICARHQNPEFREGVSLVAHAIEQGWTANRTELWALRHARPDAPAIHVTGADQRGTLAALQAGTMLRAGRAIDRVLPQHHMVAGWMSRPVNDPQRQRVMDSAHEFRDVSMIEMLSLGLRAAGHTVPSGRNPQAILRAAFSTGTVSALYETSIGSMAIAAYAEAGDFSQGWTSTTDELNLEEHDRVRLEAAPDLTLHPETGTAKPVSPSAVAEKIKVDRFSRQAPIDEIGFINDRFQLLRDIPQQFGQAAARLRPTLVAAVLLSNETMRDNVALFHAASHGNLITTSPLSQANLRVARARLARMKDGDANLNLQATHLITPAELADAAWQLTQSAVLFEDQGQGGSNPIRDITPIAESRLDTGVRDPRSGVLLAGSLSTWYLVSSQGHTIEVQFLSGTGQVPVVNVEQLTGGQFGLLITVKHYVGAKALDWRSMIQATA